MVRRLRSGPSVLPHWDESRTHDLAALPAEVDVPASEATTPEASAAYKKHGFLVVRGLLRPGEVEELRSGISSLISDWPGGPSVPESAFGLEEAHFTPLVDFDPSLVESAGAATARCDTVRRLFRVSRHVDAFRRVAQDERLLAPLREHLVPAGSGPGESGVALLQSMCLLKPPGSGEKSWHQDQAYFRAEPIDRVAAWWVALDPTGVDNGCMVVQPGSHKAGIVPHAAPTPTAKTAYRAVTAPTVGTVAVALEPGDALLFTGQTLHMTPPNRTGSRRWALQLHYAWAGCTEQRCEGAARPLRRPNATYPLEPAAAAAFAADGDWDADLETKGGFDCIEPQFWFYRSAELLASGRPVPGSITEGLRAAGEAPVAE